jgi:hypothetical protein
VHFLLHRQRTNHSGKFLLPIRQEFKNVVGKYSAMKNKEIWCYYALCCGANRHFEEIFYNPPTKNIRYFKSGRVTLAVRLIFKKTEYSLSKNINTQQSEFTHEAMLHHSPDASTFSSLR